MAVGTEAPSLLSGLMFDSDGNRMSPTHAVKKGKRYRYYVSAPLITGSRTEVSLAPFTMSELMRMVEPLGVDR